MVVEQILKEIMLNIIFTFFDLLRLIATKVPAILRRYPINDHADFRMPLDMVYFCQPEGTNTVGARKVGAAVRDATSFVFTLTDKDSGKTRYGICVNFYRPMERTTATAAAAVQPPPASTATPAARSSAIRRDSWRKSIDKSSDSAFSRQVMVYRHSEAIFRFNSI